MTNEPSFNEKLEKVLLDRLGIDKKDLNLHASLASDLNLDELERADLISSLEKELGFTIEDKTKLKEIKTVEDLIRLVEENSHEF